LVNLSKAEVNGRTEITDSSGELLLCLPLGADYGFNVSKEGYLFYSQSFPMAETKSITEPFILTLELEPVKLGAEMNLYNIYFQTDSFAILPQSVPELQKLSGFLQNNSLLKIEIQGHTDSSGDSTKNQKLSEQRAQSVVEYLIGSGIEKQRMSSKGFGDTKSIETNETIEGRRLNRRTTIKIIGN
jgi:outer membrane protein OmpA-like peptidoglycan-associated protein